MPSVYPRVYTSSSHFCSSELSVECVPTYSAIVSDAVSSTHCAYIYAANASFSLLSLLRLPAAVLAAVTVVVIIAALHERLEQWYDGGAVLFK
jgi:hypothetical protein